MIQKATKILPLLCFLVVGLVQAQTNEKPRANIWHFPNGNIWDFNSGAPVEVAGTAISFGEGSSSISDMSGNILFYTNGEEVWDRNNVLMPNGTGLLGDVSTVQPAVIVPHPGNANNYFIFTAGTSLEDQGTVGVRFSEVDMTLNSGNGDVLASNKNTLLFLPNEEKLTSVRNAAGNGYWVIAQEKSSNVWHAYEVTAAGVNMTPVTSTTGPTARIDNSLGAKFSPDGSMLATQNQCSNGSNANLCLYGFDNATGALTYRWGDCGTPGFKLAFSPDNSKLYAASFAVQQYDLSAGGGTGVGPDTAFVKASKTQVSTGSWQVTGGMQLAPDCQIYFSKSGGDVGIIYDPNLAGAACNYTPNVFTPSIGSISGRFPNFVQSFFEFSCDTPSFTWQNDCLNDTTFFTLLDSMGIDSALWSFDDPLGQPGNSSTNYTPFHIFSDTGTYNVSVITYVSGFPDTTTLPITIIDCGPVVTLTTSATTICVNDSTILQAIVIGGSAPYTYNWTPNIGTGPGPYPDSPTNTTTYIVTVTDASGNQAADTITVTVNTLPIANAGSNITVCSDSSFTLTANGGGSYNWDNGASTTASYTLTHNTAGTFDHIVVVTNGNGCIDTDTVSVTVVSCALPNISLNDTSICAGDCATLFPTIIGGVPPYTFAWTPNIGSGQGPHIVCPTTDATYTITATDNNGNTTSATATVFVNTLPTANAGSDITVCADSTFTLAGSGGVSYDWDNGTSTSASYTLVHNTTGTFNHILTVTNASGCINIDTVQVTVISCSYPLLAINDTTICEGDCASITAQVNGGNAPYTYTWYPPIGNGAGPHTICPTSDTLISVVVTDANGYTDSTSFQIFVAPTPIIDLGPDFTISVGESVTLDATSGTGSYTWTPSTYLSCSTCPITTAQPAASTSYTVFFVDDNGCSATDDILIEVDNSTAIGIPNAFSPNGDGMNDLLEVEGSGIESVHLMIYNRYGQKVFESEDLENSWDGTHNGKDINPGVFVYILEYKLYFGEFEMEKGNVTLIR